SFFQLVHLTDINYLVFDYLSEITMSIMAKAKMVEPKHGYALDFVSRVMAPLLKKIAEKKIKVISNAGGVNPLACRDALQKIIKVNQERIIFSINLIFLNKRL
ncbi:acyclic terpene utilization AtuA family protein, partial [Acinetobacter baumannii]|uniref:acyclic terpene utilization AtuA family protein n=1 Tax=Acinetobacter baumannii TaxID=470 RepID=UPI0012984334